MLRLVRNQTYIPAWVSNSICTSYHIKGTLSVLKIVQDELVLEWLLKHGQQIREAEKKTYYRGSFCRITFKSSAVKVFFFFSPQGCLINDIVVQVLIISVAGKNPFSFFFFFALEQLFPIMITL